MDFIIIYFYFIFHILFPNGANKNVLGCHQREQILKQVWYLVLNLKACILLCPGTLTPLDGFDNIMLYCLYTVKISGHTVCNLVVLMAYCPKPFCKKACENVPGRDGVERVQASIRSICGSI